jgi:large subunit ribosomal protein L22
MMLSSTKLKELCTERDVSVEQLAGHLSRGSLSVSKAMTAVKNWQKGLYKPRPSTEDIERLAGVFGVEASRLSQWRSSCRYAPMSARKARLVCQLISGRNVQDALDVLKFTRKRAAEVIRKVLESAIANADEQEADVESLYICEARADGAGRRIGTKTWIAKDRGRAHPICKEASHIHITVAEE